MKKHVNTIPGDKAMRDYLCVYTEDTAPERHCAIVCDVQSFASAYSGPLPEMCTMVLRICDHIAAEKLQQDPADDAPAVMAYQVRAVPIAADEPHLVYGLQVDPLAVSRAA